MEWSLSHYEVLIGCRERGNQETFQWGSCLFLRQVKVKSVSIRPGEGVNRMINFINSMRNAINREGTMNL